MTDLAAPRSEVLRLHRRVRLLERVVVTLVVVVVVVVIGGPQLVGYAVRKSSHSQCPLAVIQDQAYGQTPPVTIAGQNLARQVHDFVVRNHC